MTTALPRVQVLNADYRPNGTTRALRAHTLIEAGRASIIDLFDPPRFLRSETQEIHIPRAVVLTEYKAVPFRQETDYASRVQILDRDRRVCQYCGERGETIDHVYPKSRGGGNTWFNLVAACNTCNGVKGDLTPEEAGMRLMREPFRPKGL